LRDGGTWHVAERQALSLPALQPSEREKTAIDGDMVRALCQNPRHLLLELAGKPFVVAVLEGDPGTARLGDTGIPGSGRAKVARIPHDADPRIIDRLDREDGSVARGIVDHDDL